MSNIKYLRQVIQAAKRDLIHERRHEAAKKLDEAAELLVNDDASEAVKDEALVRYGKLWVSMKDELIPAIERRLEGLEKNVKDLEVRHDRQCFLNDRIATYADADLLKRLEKMEKALSEEMAKTREMDDILAGVVKKVGYVSEAPEGGGGAAPFVSPASTSAAPPIVDRELKFTTAGPCHTICIMPNGSPSDIPFSVALEYLKAGRKLTHPSFGEGNSIEASAQNSILMHWPDEGKWTNFVMDSALALSDAWTVLPEKPQNP